MKNTRSIIILIMLASSLLKADIIMGVVPQQGPLKLFNIWNPVAKYLSKEIGVKVRFRTARSIDAFQEKLYNGEYDFAYVNPMQYVLLNKKYHYEPLVRSDRLIKGIIVMQKGKKLKHSSAKKFRLIFSSPGAFAATMLIKYDLIEKFGFSQKEIDSARYVNSHDSVYKALARNFGDLGGGIVRTFNYKDNLPLHKKLYVAHTTEGYPTHPFSVKASLSNDIKLKLSRALLQLPKELLSALQMKKLIKVSANEYKSVERLIKKLNIIER